ncbi:uncharacterized protein LOC118646740 [Monomorium pharaonis]|uniref:uncharacterized protein LOC118646740 n=1 Tax=Monomorium pharaonis TaxID=307658 RepID=UPI0017473E25|nr:uncharacterized protein LOC118646740 [Monomorium pharaonis]
MFDGTMPFCQKSPGPDLWISGFPEIRAVRVGPFVVEFPDRPRRFIVAERYRSPAPLLPDNYVRLNVDSSREKSDWLRAMLMKFGNRLTSIEYNRGSTNPLRISSETCEQVRSAEETSTCAGAHERARTHCVQFHGYELRK